MPLLIRVLLFLVVVAVVAVGFANADSLCQTNFLDTFCNVDTDCVGNILAFCPQCLCIDGRCRDNSYQLIPVTPIIWDPVCSGSNTGNCIALGPVIPDQLPCHNPPPQECGMDECCAVNGPCIQSGQTPIRCVGTSSINFCCASAVICTKAPASPSSSITPSRSPVPPVIIIPFPTFQSSTNSLSATRSSTPSTTTSLTASPSSTSTVSQSETLSQTRTLSQTSLPTASRTASPTATVTLSSTSSRTRTPSATSTPQQQQQPPAQDTNVNVDIDIVSSSSGGDDDDEGLSSVWWMAIVLAIGVCLMIVCAAAIIWSTTTTTPSRVQHEFPPQRNHFYRSNTRY